jgi:hypothetical protein
VLTNELYGYVATALKWDVGYFFTGRFLNRNIDAS